MNRNASGLLFLVAAGLISIAAGKRSNTRAIDPVKGTVTSGFGDRIHPISKKVEFHNGVDISCKEGTPVLAPWSGKIIKAYYGEKGGNQLVIKHDNGFQSGYAHLSKFIGKVGETVVQGEAVALSGNTGKSTGPHVHMTLRNANGDLVDPSKYFDFAS